jgi:hypothetical protein
MSTNYSIDRGLLEEAMKVSGESSESAVLAKALGEYIARRSPRRILELVGKFDWDPACDYKRGRSRG